MNVVPGLAAFAGVVDAMLVDQFGTIHDGRQPYPGAVHALTRLRDAGTQLVIITNSGRRAAKNIGRLSRMGIDPALYHDLVCSGEIGWQTLKHGAAGKRCLLLSRDQDRSVLDGTEAIETRDAHLADLIVIAGSEGDRFPLDHFRTLLRPAAERGVPALCLNPDRIMLSPAGPVFGAGQIAEAYERLGGTVTWIGKPHPPLFEAALATLHGPERDRVLVVGDSVEHDVAGARQVNCRAALVRSGILAGKSDTALKAEYVRCGVQPDALLAAFVW